MIDERRKVLIERMYDFFEQQGGMSEKYAASIECLCGDDASDALDVVGG